MDRPLISVCINCYNAENTIADTVHSVLAQTYSHLQVIVVDDCSEDSTLEVLRAIQDDRLEIYPLEKNDHISIANNEAFRRAKGEYIAHIDADDTWVPHKLETQLRFLQEHPDYGACFSLTNPMDEHGTPVEDDRFRAENYAPEAFFRRLLVHGNFLNYSSMFARKDVIDRIGKHDPSLLYFHDYDYWLRMSIVCPIYVSEERLVNYRIWSTSNSAMHEGKQQAHINEFADIAYRRVLDCPDEFFLKAFADTLRLQGVQHTKEQVALEKAFILCDKIAYLPQNPALAIRRLDELMREDATRACAEKDFGFTVHDLYTLHGSTVYHNITEHNDLKAYGVHMRNLHAQAVGELQNANQRLDALEHRLQAVSAEKQAIEEARAHLQSEHDSLAAVYAQTVHQLDEIVNSSSWKLTAPLRSLGTKQRIRRTARSPRLRDGRPAKGIVVMYGFFAHNLGDDLFFDLLLRRYPDTVFVVYDANNYDTFFSRYPNVYWYVRSDPRVQLIDAKGEIRGRKEAFESMLLAHADAVVHIGGSIYQQIGTWEEDLRMREKRVNKHKPFFSISSNFGPYHTEGYLNHWRRQFQKCHDICFRDRYSENLFSDIKAVRYAPDLLFSLPLPHADVVEDQLFVSLLNPFSPGASFDNDICERYTKTLIDVVTMHTANGHRVVLSSFCAFQGDEATVDTVVNAVPDKQRPLVSVVNFTDNGDFTPVLQALVNSEYVLATRFHAVLLGLTAGKKVLPVCYNQKQTYMLSDLEYPGTTYTLKLFGQTDAATLLNDLQTQPLFDVSDPIAKAGEQFSRLDAYIRKRGGTIQEYIK